MKVKVTVRSSRIAVARFLVRLKWIGQFGAVFAVVLAAVHPTSSIQIGGADASSFPSWLVLVAAIPFVIAVELAGRVLVAWVAPRSST